MHKNLFKILSIVAFLLAFVFLFYGLYLFKIKPNEVKQKKYVTKDVIYFDKQGNVINKIHKKSENLCGSGRWKKLEIVEDNKELLLDNKALFSQFDTATETQGRHKDQQSIPLSLLFNQHSLLSIKVCDGSEFNYSKEQVVDNNIRLVLNSKGGFKLIQEDDQKITVIAKYLLSITKSND